MNTVFSYVNICFSLGSTRKELPGVEQYEIVYPQRLHKVHKRDVQRNKEVLKEITLLSWEMGKVLGSQSSLGDHR